MHPEQQDNSDDFERALEFHEAGRLVQADAIYRRLLEAEPGAPDILYLRGVVAYQQQQFSTAGDYLERSLRGDPDNADARHLRGMVHYQDQQYEKALEHIGRCIALRPGQAEAHYNLGNAQAMLERWSEAIASYREALDLEPDSVDTHWQLGRALLAADRPGDASAQFECAAALEPDEPDHHFYLAGALLAAGRTREAMASYQRTLALAPGHAPAHGHLGDLYIDEERFSEALVHYRQAAALEPGNAARHLTLGNLLSTLGDADAAMASYRNVIALQADHADAHNNLGNLLYGKGELDAATHCYRRALAARHDHRHARHNLGNILQQQGRIEAAIACYQELLALEPDFPDAHSSLANACLKLNRMSEATESYRRALSLKPDSANAHFNLGNALLIQGEFSAAAARYRAAIARDPEHAESHNNLGLALHRQFQASEAFTCFQTALALQPDHARAHNNMGNVLGDLGEIERALAHYRESIRLAPDYSGAYNNYLVSAQYSGDWSPSETLANHRRFAERFEMPLRARWPAHANSRDPLRRLKIGFVSGDFSRHPVGFFLENTLLHLDRDLLDITLYPTYLSSDELALRFQNMGFPWRPLVTMSDDDAAQRVVEDRIDILVDLSGHTAHNRLLLFARKPAPIQVTWLGYWSTTGLSAMDYILCDEAGLPKNEAVYFTEKPWYLPDTRLCFTPPETTLAIGPLPALARGHITFGCFNNLTKMGDDVVSLWSRILREIPGSQLLLKARQLSNPATRETTRARFAAQGIDADRLQLEGQTRYQDYLAAYHRIDIMLDPFPFTGATTSVEGLWMGVPLITRRGDRMISRQGEGILRNLNMPDWIADDNDAYIAIARRQAADWRNLALLRQQLRARLLASALCDGPRFARALESALRGMWRAYCTRQ